jgi:hypothetical protein
MVRVNYLVGFLFSLLLLSTAESRELNPFYEKTESSESSFLAVRPLYSRTVVEEGKVQDVFWPLYSRKEFKDEATSRALIFYYTHRFGTDQEEPRKRRWLLPFWFSGRDAQGEEYAALFPLGGSIHEFIGRDRLSFVLFPLYGTGQINDVKTTNVLWPILSRTRGEGIRRDRVFPIAGKSVLEGRYEKKFILWPFWTSAKYTDPANPGNAWILFPLYGRTNLEKENTVWVVPPFFRFTKGDKQDRIYCPWPFYQRVDSESLQKHYIWPLWGKKQRTGGLKDRTFVLWPFFWSERSETPLHEHTRKLAVPVFTLERSYLKDAGNSPENKEPVSSYWRIWPLMSRYCGEDGSHFRMLELWPVRDAAPVERNWAPLWTLYSRTDDGGTVTKDLLWFIWHSERSEKKECSEWSLLKGLLSCKNDGGSKKVRLLYLFKFGE